MSVGRHEHEPITSSVPLYAGGVARRANERSGDPLVPGPADEDVTPEAFTAWLDQLQVGEPLRLGVTAADTLAEARAAGEVSSQSSSTPRRASNSSSTPCVAEHSVACCRSTPFHGLRTSFYVEVGTVLRRWDLSGVLTPAQVGKAVHQLSTWPLRIGRVRPLFATAWRYRHNITFADAATYVALAEHLGAQLLTDDHRLANAPALPVPVLRLGIQP